MVKIFRIFRLNLLILLITSLMFGSSIFAKVTPNENKDLYTEIESSKKNPRWYSIFYIGLDIATLNFKSALSNRDFINVKELIPSEDLIVPVHPFDIYAVNDGVKPFTYEELNGYYLNEKVHIPAALLTPRLGIHILPQFDLEVSYAWLNLYFYDVYDFPESRGKDYWPEQRTSYYMHQYANGADAFTVIRFSSKFKYHSFWPKLNWFKQQLGLSVGIQKNSLTGTYKSQSGWDRYYSFGEYKSFMEVKKKIDVTLLTVGIKFSSLTSKKVKTLFGKESKRRTGWEIALMSVIHKTNFGFLFTLGLIF